MAMNNKDPSEVRLKTEAHRQSQPLPLTASTSSTTNYNLSMPFNPFGATNYNHDQYRLIHCVDATISPISPISAMSASKQSANTQFTPYHALSANGQSVCEERVLELKLTLIHNKNDPDIPKYRWSANLQSLSHEALPSILVDRIKGAETQCIEQNASSVHLQ